MKVKVKEEYIGSEEFNGWLKNGVDLNSELIVLGIDCEFISYDKLTNYGNYRVKYIFAQKYASWPLIDSKFFNIVDESMPNDWIITERRSDITMTYKCDNEQFTIDLLYSDTIESYELLNKYQKEEETKYYNLEIDNFFANENLKLSEEEKKSMIEYYKSQLNSEQWEKDKDFLKELDDVDIYSILDNTMPDHHSPKFDGKLF